MSVAVGTGLSDESSVLLGAEYTWVIVEVSLAMMVISLLIGATVEATGVVADRTGKVTRMPAGITATWRDFGVMEAG